MMTLQILCKDKELMYEIADYLLKENLIANAIITDNTVYKELDENGTIITNQQYSLKAFSKSLLFSTINEKLKERYGDRMPLVYSEPIILIDTEHTDRLLSQLVKV